MLEIDTFIVDILVKMNSIHFEFSVYTLRLWLTVHAHA